MISSYQKPWIWLITGIVHYCSLRLVSGAWVGGTMPLIPATPIASRENSSLSLRTIGFDTDLTRRRSRFSPELCKIPRPPEGTEFRYEAAMHLIDERDLARREANAAAAAEP